MAEGFKAEAHAHPAKYAHVCNPVNKWGVKSVCLFGYKKGPIYPPIDSGFIKRLLTPMQPQYADRAAHDKTQHMV